MDQKGQISIEFVLVIGLIVVIVLAIAPYIGEQNENNVIAVAAREGASNTITNITLLNRNMAPIVVKDLKMTGSGQNITIQIRLSSSVSSDQNQLIVNGTLASIAAQGYTLTNGTIVTNRHRYNVTLV